MASKPPAAPTRLQLAIRAAIEKHGLQKTAKAVGVWPATLQRFAFTPGASHKGTVLQAEKAWKEGKLT